MGASLRKAALGDHNLETFSLVWLDGSVNTSEENVNVQQQLRTLINHLKTFENADECVQYIRSVSKQNRIVLIVSGRLGREIVPRIHRLRQVSSIYVYCMDKQANEQWANKFQKVNNTFLDN
jgi:virulence-associated protein VapD